MNTKVILGILAAGCVCLGLFIVVNKKKSVPVELPTSVSETATSSVKAAPTPTTSHISITQGAVRATKTYSVAVDASTLTSTSTRPTITGTGDVAMVGVVIKDSSGKGLVGTSDIEVVDGHWQYTTPITLTPGIYTVVVFGAPTPVTASLTITAK